MLVMWTAVLSDFQTFRTLTFRTQAFRTLGDSNQDSNPNPNPAPNPNSLKKRRVRYAGLRKGWGYETSGTRFIQSP